MAPKWQKIEGDEHTMAYRALAYDLLGMEEFLNDMSRQGWRLIRVHRTNKFTFVPGYPGEFVYRVASPLTDGGFPDKQATAALAAYATAWGATLVAQTYPVSPALWFRTLIVQRPASLGPFELYPDLNARIAEHETRRKRLEKFGLLALVLGVCYFVMGISQGRPLNIGLSSAWIVMAIFYLRPVVKYRALLARLKTERDLQ